MVVITTDNGGRKVNLQVEFLSTDEEDVETGLALFITSANR